MSRTTSSLLVVGSVGLDTVETRAGKRAEVLGGAASYFSVAASFLAPVRLTAVVGTDFPEAHTKLLADHAVDLAGLERVSGKTFRWSGVYAKDFSTRTTLDTQLNVFQDFNPKLPAGWGNSEYVFLANIDPVLQLSVLEQAGKPRFVACDTMNFWIEGKRDALLKLLARVDMLLLNDEEARQLSGEANLPAAARAIRALGPKAVVIKRGDAGALLFHEAGVFMGWMAREGVVDPMTIRTAMILGSVLASFSVEDFSLDRFRRLDLSQIRERFAAFADLVHFEKIKL